MADLDDLFNVFDEKDVESKVGAPNVQGNEAEAESVASLSQSSSKSEDLSSKRDHPNDERPGKSKKQKKSKKSNSSGNSTEEERLAKETPVEGDEGDEINEKNVESLMDDVNLDEVIPRITVHTVEALSCTHEVAVPPNMTYAPLVPATGKPFKEYSFPLDAFQKEAILCIENNQSVLVSAHTSAGKTVCAAYAIAKSLAEKQRVIYTTPIKALSNQKYREFFEEFHDVGLVTGDVTINPTASCLIMTTEILRNMLYRGSEVMREVGWVVFDEIHYMRDKERGVVWEETLILLPNNVHHVFLSATIPNARQFAEWVTHLHQQPCHVVYTDYRPVPLQHYIFPAGGDGIHLVVDENGTFKEDNFNTAMTVLANAGDAAKGDQQRGRRGGMLMTNKGETNIFKIVKMIMERSYAPVIIFSFSKKECEMYAMQMAKLDFNTMEEKKMVGEVFGNAMDILSEEDKCLPQVENVLPLLRRGIGIHHGGLLPILKETIEILFAEGLIKALFATETFAMGLNMPARTVLFTCPRKFDGKEMRWITSGEYIQMSGRAGRRGLDDKGIVILMIDEKVSPAVGREIVKGLPDAINSAFHLTYNMVLNLLRVEEINPEYMLERSFYQFQNMASIPVLVDKVKAAQEAYEARKVPKENQIATYYRLRQQLQLLSNDFRGYLTQPKYVIPFLQPGRMVKVKYQTDDEFDWGVIVNFKKLQEGPKGTGTNLVVEVLLHIAEDSEEPMPCPPNKAGKMEVVPIVQTLIMSLSSLRLYIPNDLRPADHRKSVLKSIKEVKQRFSNGPPLLNPVEDMKIKEESFLEVVKKIEAFEERLFAHPLHESDELDDLYKAYEEKYALGEELSRLKKEMKMAKSVLQMDELKCRKRVLRRLGYSTAADVIEMKGRVACELSSIDELLMTEMIFNNLFVNLSVPQCVALLSCFVCDEKSNEQSKMSEELGAPLKQMQELARRIAKVSTEAKLEMNEDEYVERFKPFLMDVVHAWCKGSTFLQLCEMTDIFEGSIIRCMRRLEEVLRQMCQAAKNIGNVELENKFSEGIKLLKRDIVFAASLYL